VMPRFFFHIRTESALIVDDEGEDQKDLVSVREQALESARELMAGCVLRGKEPDGDKFEITDEAGEVVLVLPFRDALTK
jgi:hypothetical protein